MLGDSVLIKIFFVWQITYDSEILCLKDFLSFNSVPNGKILYMTKLKTFAGDKINVAQMMISVFDWVENSVGKGENAGYQHFLLFPRFQKASFSGVLKVKIVW